MKTIHLIVTAAALLAAGSARAEEGGISPAEARMREQLKTVMLQLRDVQGQLAAAQAQAAAAAAEKDARIAELTDKNVEQAKQVEALARECTTARKEAEETIAALNAGVEKQTAQAARLTATLGKWKEAYAQVTAVAQAQAAARSALEVRAAELQLKVEDRERKNVELYRLGQELLTRYEKFGLGDALTAREPFVGTTRVKFETLVQDYKDKLDDQMIASAAASKAPAPAQPVPAAEQKPSAPVAPAPEIEAVPQPVAQPKPAAPAPVAQQKQAVPALETASAFTIDAVPPLPPDAPRMRTPPASAQGLRGQQ
jgi:uncharacterized coiled-coil protein SlyX